MKSYNTYIRKLRAKGRKGFIIFIAVILMLLLCLRLMGNIAKSEEPSETSSTEDVCSSEVADVDNGTDSQPYALDSDDPDAFGPEDPDLHNPEDPDAPVSGNPEILVPEDSDADVLTSENSDTDALTPEDSDTLISDDLETSFPEDAEAFIPEDEETAAGDDTHAVREETDPEAGEDIHDEHEEMEIIEDSEIESINEDMSPPIEMAALAEEYTYAAIIDLSAKSDSVTGPGYTISGGPGYAYDNRFLVTNPTGYLAFNQYANGNTYQVIQSGVPIANIISPNGLKYGTSMVMSISIPDKVSVTLVISDIHLIGSITLAGSANLTLLLDGQNYVRTSIQVPITGEITIDSLNGSNDDCLTMPSEAKALSDNAKIGSRGASGTTVGNSAGKITINGGTIDITVYSTGAGIGGGGCGDVVGNGTAGNVEMVEINGGSVSVTQYGSGNDRGKGISGAGIGGGGGIGNVKIGGAGNVVITGGTVTVRQYTRAAGIGGGTFGPAGNITIEGGDIDVEVIRLVNEPFAGEGAAIGNAAGTNPGTGSITISGGTVRAVAFMTGIGRVHGRDSGSDFDISITGGTVYAKGTNGPGIGSWINSVGNTITITGGTVIAESDNITGIGSGADNNAHFHLDATANVRAYSGGTLPAINTADNSGDGYFVNASFLAPLSYTTATKLYAYSEDRGKLQKTLSLPAAYRHFAYSSDLTSSRTDSILAYNSSSVLLGTVLRVHDSSPQIYSVITRAGYNAHNNNANNGALPVKLNADDCLMVTEKYVDIYGNPIEGVDDSISLIGAGKAYSKEIPTISGYIGKGYKWDAAPDGSGKDYTPGFPLNTAVTENITVYFVYALISPIAELTISKTVTGDYADKTRYFEFTVYFEDSGLEPLPVGTEFTYEIIGSGITEPIIGLLILDNDGKANFFLQHGQSIIIGGVPTDNYARIIETLDYFYDVSFIDSEDIASAPIIGNDTGMMEMTADRIIGFINDRIYVPATGISADNTGSILMYPILMLLTCPAYLTVKISRRRR